MAELGTGLTCRLLELLMAHVFAAMSSVCERAGDQLMVLPKP